MKSLLPGWKDAAGFWGLYGVASALALLPLWTVTWLPLSDYAGHLELMDVVARYHDPETLYQEVYVLPGGFGPNTLSLGLAWLFSGWIGVDSLGRLLLSFYILGFPFSLLLVARAFERSHWMSFFAFPLAFNAMLNLGFLNFLIGLPLLFAAVAFTRRFGDGGRLRDGVTLAFVLLLLYFSHVIPFMIASGISLAGLLLYTRSRRQLVRLVVLLPSLLLFSRWVWVMMVEMKATEAGRSFRTESGLGFVFAEKLELLRSFHTWGMQYFKSATDEIAFGALFLCWVLVFLASAYWGWRARRAQSPRMSWLFGYGPTEASWAERVRAKALEGLTCACLVAYLLLPSHMNEMAIITERVVILILAFGLLWPKAPFEGWRQRLVFAPVVLLAFGYPLAVQREFEAFESEEIAGMPALVASLPERSRMVYVMLERNSARTYMGTVWHIPKAIHSLENGGVTPDSFAIRPYTPVQYQPGQSTWSISRLRRNFYQSPHLFTFDHVLVRANDLPPGALKSPWLRLRGNEGLWWLFDVVDEEPGGGVIRISGNHQGALRSMDCPDGEVLVGIMGRLKEQGMLEATPICATEPSKIIAPSYPTQKNPRFSLSCAAGTRLTGLEGSYGEMITSLSLLCDGGGAPEPIGEAGAHENRFSLRCPEETQPRGLRVKGKIGIFALGMGCR